MCFIKSFIKHALKFLFVGAILITLLLTSLMDNGTTASSGPQLYKIEELGLRYRYQCDGFNILDIAKTFNVTIYKGEEKETPCPAGAYLKREPQTLEVWAVMATLDTGKTWITEDLDEYTWNKLTVEKKCEVNLDGHPMPHKCH